MLRQVPQAVPDAVDGGFLPGVEQEHAETAQLLRCQGASVEAAGRERAEYVVRPRGAPALRTELIDVGDHLSAGAIGASPVGQPAVEDVLCPPHPPLRIGLRDLQEQRQDTRDERQRVILDEVPHPGGLDRLQQLGCDTAESGLEPGDRVAGEQLADELAVLPMIRRVYLQRYLLEVPPYAHRDGGDAGLGRGEHGPVQQRPAHVLIPRQDEVAVVPFAEVNRIFLAQPVINRERIPDKFRGIVVELGICAHLASLGCRHDHAEAKSIGMLLPVTAAAAGEVSHTSASATSWVVSQRCTGLDAISPASLSSLRPPPRSPSIICASNGVSTPVGHTPMTRMPSLATSSPRTRTSMPTPALETQ